MKKLKVLLVALLLLVMVPFNVKAEENQNEAPKEKITVYMFRGEGCGFCAKALTFFESIEEEYGQYFDLVTYEVWEDSSNKKLMNKVINYLNANVTGIPVIIIGEKIYPGFQDAWGEDIKKDIITEYNRSVDERVDVIKEVQDSEGSDWVTPLVIGAVAVGLVAFVVVARLKTPEKQEMEQVGEEVKNLPEKEITEVKVEKEEKEEVPKKQKTTAKKEKAKKETPVKETSKKETTKKSTSATKKKETAKKTGKRTKKAEENE